MAPEGQSVVHSTRAWLQSSWHIQVPFAWLEACVEWLQDEAGGAGRLSQQQVNQQVSRVHAYASVYMCVACIGCGYPLAPSP